MIRGLPKEVGISGPRAPDWAKEAYESGRVQFWEFLLANSVMRSRYRFCSMLNVARLRNDIATNGGMKYRRKLRWVTFIPENDTSPTKFLLSNSNKPAAVSHSTAHRDIFFPNVSYPFFTSQKNCLMKSESAF